MGPDKIRLAIIIVLVIMITSSSFLIFNPAPVIANLSRVDSSNYHSDPRIPETTAARTAPSISSQDGDFTAQAALSLTRATQTNNIVNTKAYYDISFRSTTSGAIKTIEMDFPDGTYVGSALLVEAVGIGAGTISIDNVDDKITYTVTNAVNIPANTKIRIQLANINNPSISGSALTVTITTKNAGGGIIDGPTSTNGYNVKQIGTQEIANGAVTSGKMATDAVTTGAIENDAVINDKIANNAVTSPKIADGSIGTLDISEDTHLRSAKLIRDDATGHSVGWDPDDIETSFTIFFFTPPGTEPVIQRDDAISVTVICNDADGIETCPSAICGVNNVAVDAPDVDFQRFHIACTAPPVDGADLVYTITHSTPL